MLKIIPMLKIRRSYDRLIFNIGILIPRKDFFILRWGPGCFKLTLIAIPVGMSWIAELNMTLSYNQCEMEHVYSMYSISSTHSNNLYDQYIPFIMFISTKIRGLKTEVLNTIVAIVYYFTDTGANI